MSAGLAVQLPLIEDNVFGPYGLITDYTTLATQNFKMLLLTIPGERIMNPDFGVGLKQYLFELDGDELYAAINNRIVTQVKRYMPFIQVNKVEFQSPENNADLFPYTMSMTVYFTIIPLQAASMLQIEFNN